MISFFSFIAFIILLRMIELWYSKRNEKWLRANGAIEYGQKHYPFIVLLHTTFIRSVILEFLLWGGDINFYLLGIYILLIMAKIWVLSSLGHYWNTKIFRVPHVNLVKKGPYRYFKHPNYFIVVCEIAIIPLVFHLCYSAVVFSILNAIMLSVRIKEEEKVWND
jgi:methyltransferase